MFYKFARRIVIILGHIIYRLRITGRENIPLTGAAIICGNHISAMDPLAMAICTKRQVFFMGKQELFKGRFLGLLLRSLGAFAVDRAGTDLKAYRHTMQILKDEKALGIFSQGTRTQDFDNVKGGVAVFALKSGAPIIPMGIRGTYRPFSKLYINIGPPIYMEQYKGRKVKSDLVEEVMAELVSRVSELSQ